MLYFVITIFVFTFPSLAWTTIQNSSTPNLDCNRPSYFPDEECCIVPNIVTEELMEKCGDLIEGSHSNMALSHLILEYCFMNCVINETKIIDDDGELNNENISNFVNKVFADTPDMIPIVVESFRECFDASSFLRENIEPEDNCTPQKSFIMDCLSARIFMFCTESAWSNTEVCNDAREYTHKCLPKFLYMKL